MTNQDLADRLGVTRQQVSKYVNENRKMSLKTAINIAIILNVSVFDLYELIEVGAKK